LSSTPGLIFIDSKDELVSHKKFCQFINNFKINFFKSASFGGIIASLRICESFIIFYFGVFKPRVIVKYNKLDL
jgi:hypothetical protein